MADRKTEALKRLSYIEGHLRGIRRMIEDDEYCMTVLHQTHAVKKALDRLDGLLVEGHMAHCVPRAFEEGRGDEVIRELVELFGISRK